MVTISLPRSKAPESRHAQHPKVEEAGGSFTSLDGSPGYDLGNALATNGLLHQAVLAVLQR